MRSVSGSPGSRLPSMIRAVAISYAGFVGAFVTSIIVSRLLGVEGKGLFSLFIATVGGLAVFGGIGLPHGHMYHASRDPRWLRHFMHNAVLLATLVGGAAGAGYFFGGRALRLETLAPLDSASLAAGVVAVPVAILLIYQRQFFLVLRRYEVAKASFAVAQTIPLAAYVLLYALGRRDVTAFILAYVLTQVICLAGFAAIRTPEVPQHGGLSGELALSALRFGARQFASDLALYLTSRLDFFVVLLYLGTAGLGIYSVAVGLAEITIRLSNEIGTMLFPVFAEGRLKPGQAATALRIVTLLAVSIAVVLEAVSGPVVRLLFGQQFTPAVPAFRILLIGTVAWSTTHVTWPFVSAGGRPGLGVPVYGVAALIDLGLDLVLLPRWGVTGAAVAAVSSYLVAAVLFFRLFRQREPCSFREAFIPRPGDIRLVSTAARQALSELWRAVFRDGQRSAAL